MREIWSFCSVVLLISVAACTTSRPFTSERFRPLQKASPESELTYRVFLVGDAGYATSDPIEPPLRLLRNQLADAGSDAAVVFLGDNIYPFGLSDSGAVRRERDEQRLLAQLSVVEDFEGRIVFIPGNHDWNDSKPGGLEAVARQEKFVEDYLDRGNTFLPDGGFPGPARVKLNDRLRLLAIDTQWWLHPENKSFGDTGEYDLAEEADFLLELDDLIKRYDDEDLIVVGHHPIMSNGAHAGVLPARDHIFPLRNLHPALILPLPVAGSIYPLSVRLRGGRQDIYHPRYKAMRESLKKVFGQHEDLIFVSGHDHSLQYFPQISDAGFRQHFVVSGAGSGPSPLGRGRGAGFVASVKGFAIISQYADGSLWLEMWEAVGDGSTGNRLFHVELRGPARELADPGAMPLVEEVDYSDSTVTMAANENYAAGGLKSFLLGKHRRSAWAAPVEAPVFDVGHEAGGLQVGKRGGGMQTISIRLADSTGREYVIRSIDKDPSATVPASLQGTIATDIVQDQIASIHPYGAFIIPKLADAAGVFHTNPKIVYVPQDPRLGIYNDLFAGRLAMFEERPDDDMSDQPSFGRSRDVISDSKLYSEITDDNDHRIDHRAFARARLFDMLLSDWDRHKGQWRWASFEPYELDSSLEGDARTEGKIYLPIPRDRDWAFNRMNGVFPSLASMFDPKFQDFTESFGYLKGLALNGLAQDRRFVSPLTRKDFVEIAEELQEAITDEVIEAAVRDWPESIFELDGQDTIRLLKIRRDKLRKVAEEYYEMHARIVDVVGSHKHERFEVKRLHNDSTRVTVFKTNKKGQKRRLLYDRVLLTDETREVRLYGLDGNDTFVVDGQTDKGIVVRAIGGSGEDTFLGESNVRGPGKKTVFYDTDTGNTWETGPETKTVTSADPGINYYDPGEFKHNARFPLLFFGRNSDDGPFIGGGMNFVRQGFRKAPYAASHRVKANFAARTLAFNAVYEGHYVDAAGSWDVTFDAAYLGPNNIRNFYGLGNKTRNERDDREFYQARLRQITVNPALFRVLEQGVTIRLGPTFQLTDVDGESDRFVNQPQAGVAENTFEVQTFGGLDAEVLLDTRDRAVNPRRGLAWSSRGHVNIGLNNTSDTFVRLSSDLSFFLTSSQARWLTLASRIGGAHNFNDFPFYSANTLGDNTNLRGFLSTRFAGRTSFYQNVELRAQLFTFSTYVAIGRLGILGFLDNGRVWTEADDDTDVSQAFFKGYHQGYGGGAWVEMFDALVLTAVAGYSEDGTTFTLKFGFQY